MVASPSERPAPPETGPAPEPGSPISATTEQEALGFVRELAARRDPGRGRAYDLATPARVKHSAAVAQRLLAAHLRLMRQSPPNRGRRRHNAEVYDLLAQTNEAALVLALAVLDLAFVVLPPGVKDD